MSVIKLFSESGFAFDIDKISSAIMEVTPVQVFDLSETEKQNYHDFIRIMGEVGWPAFIHASCTILEQSFLNMPENIL